MTIRLDLHHRPGTTQPRIDCYECEECGRRFTSARWLIDHIGNDCQPCARHAAPPISSEAREATARPYHGKRRNELGT